MNNQPLALTIDFGTQSVRTMIFDKSGQTIAMAKRPYEPAYFSLKPGYAEQNPRYYWETLCSATNELASKYPEILARVTTMAMTCFRDSPVFLDKDMNVVRPTILWLDQRESTDKPNYGFVRNVLFKLTGLTDTVMMNTRRTPARWIKQHEPENWAKITHYVHLSTFLTYQLTGKLIDSSANQTGHFPIDFKKGVWYTDSALKAPVFGIPRKLLCDLVKPGQQLGSISEECSLQTGLPKGLPIFASGTDKGAETIGTGCLTKDMASISYGTASSIEVSNPKYIEPEPFLPAYQASIPNLYNMEVQVYRGYWMVTWFKKEFGISESAEATIQKMATEEILNNAMMNIEPGSHGLVLQPYWGPSLRHPEAKGAVIGWSDTHTHIHLYRAIVEGIAYALREGLEGMEKRQHQKIKEIRVSGGGSQSDAICQITADIFGIPVSRIQTYETASLGTAILAFTAHGDFVSYHAAIDSMVHPSKTFIPDPEAHSRYDYLYRKVYTKLYAKLKKFYVGLKEFNQ